MEAVMLIAERANMLPVFQQTIRSVFPFAKISVFDDHNGFKIEFSSHSRIYLELYGDDLKSIGWDNFEIDLITEKFPSSHFVYSIAYHSIELVKKIIVSLANSDQMMVDNDCGYLLIGSALVNKILNEPNWNWLQEYRNRD